MHALLLATTGTSIHTPQYNFSISFLLTLLLLWVGTYFTVKLIKLLIKKGTSKKKKLISAIIGGAFLAGAVIHSSLVHTNGMLFSSFTLIFIAAIALISLFSQFFKRTASALIFILLFSIVILAALFIRSLTAFTSTKKIAIVRVLGTDKEGATIQFEHTDGRGKKNPTIYKIKGDRFGVIIYKVLFKDMAVFLGAKTRYAVLGLSGKDLKKGITQDILFPDAFNRLEIFTAVEKKELNIPFVKSAQLDFHYKVIVPKAVYEVYIKNSGGDTIRRKQ